MELIQEGQTWYYKYREQDTNSYLFIFKIENNDEEKIIHTAIKNVLIGKEQMDIDHMPFASQVFLDSLKLLKGIEKVTENYQEAYQTWKDQKGGVWSIPIKEAIQIIEDNMVS